MTSILVTQTRIGHLVKKKSTQRFGEKIGNEYNCITEVGFSLLQNFPNDWLRVVLGSQPGMSHLPTSFMN